MVRVLEMLVGRGARLLGGSGMRGKGEAEVKQEKACMRVDKAVSGVGSCEFVGHLVAAGLSRMLRRRTCISCTEV